MDNKRITYTVANVAALVSGVIATAFIGLTSGFRSLMPADEFAKYGYNSAEEMTEDVIGPLVGHIDRIGMSHYISGMVWGIIICLIIFAASVGVMCVLSGRFSKDEKGNIRLNSFDRIWFEFLVLGWLLFFGLGYVPILNIKEMTKSLDWFDFFEPLAKQDAVYGLTNLTSFALCLLGAAICIEIGILCFVSLIKRLKAHKFIETTLLGKTIIFIYESFRAIGRDFTVPHDEDEKVATKLVIKYFVCLMFLAVITARIPLIGLIITFVVLTVFIPKKVRQFTEIRKGVIEVKSGNLAYRIPVEADQLGPKTEFDKLAADVNEISKAVDIAVQNEMKNQRSKLELISNVSHDLRTPLTSIISYIDILKKEGLDSPDAEAHLAILEDKTAKLKILIDSLFEAAKASSGDIYCELTDIDLAAIINQELAEMGDVLKKNKLRIVKNVTAENTMVRADGQHLARVIENLLGNVSKYALKGSRVYVDIRNTVEDDEDSKKVCLEIKNISRDELNISPDELTERFIRGDKSRNTEGSGLGLAIAKDLTALMGGELKIQIDGDMFKALVVLAQA